MAMAEGSRYQRNPAVTETEIDGEIFLVTQKDGEQLQPGADDLHQVGTMATIVQTLHLPDGNTKVLVEGRRRGRIVRFVQQSDFFEV
ncbi:MAG: hypothetical protein HN732_26875, partial [Rhodospirillaceae bacterium]|nr:hypothetical protein [Rhodospirillaceae bacterium]